MLYLQPYDVEKMAFFFRTLLLVTTPHNDPPRDTDTQCTHQPTTLHSKHHLLTQWGDQVAWVTSAQAIMVAAEFVCCLRKKKKLKNSAPKPFLRTWLQLRTRVKQAEDGVFFFSNTQQATVLLWQFKNVTPDSSQAFLWAALRGWTNLDGESKVIVESLNNCPLKGPSGGSFPVGRGSHVRSHCHTMASKCSRLAPVTVRVPDGEAWAGALFFFFFFYLTGFLRLRESEDFDIFEL